MAAVIILSIFRCDIIHERVNALEFIASFHAVTTEHRRVVDTRIHDEGVLLLRIRTAPAIAAVTADGLRIQTTGQTRIGRQARQRKDRIAHARRALARHRARQAQAEFEQRSGTQVIRHTARQLLIQHKNACVVFLAENWCRDRRRFKVIHLAMADAHEAA